MLLVTNLGQSFKLPGACRNVARLALKSISVSHGCFSYSYFCLQSNHDKKYVWYVVKCIIYGTCVDLNSATSKKSERNTILIFYDYMTSDVWSQSINMISWWLLFKHNKKRTATCHNFEFQYATKIDLYTVSHSQETGAGISREKKKEDGYIVGSHTHTHTHTHTLPPPAMLCQYSTI